MDISSSIDRAVSTYFSNWLGQHSYIAWSIAHPLLGCGLLLLAIGSLWGLFGAIGRAIEQIWLFILKTPFKLFQPIFGKMWKISFGRLGHSTPDRERIDIIVDRLQVLSQEQERLLKELSRLRNASLDKLI
jgi:hypothetical protein